MIKNKCHSLIIGGTGQFGITLKDKLNKTKKRIIITSRFKKNIAKKKLFEIIVLNIFDKKNIVKVIKKFYIWEKNEKINN